MRSSGVVFYHQGLILKSVSNKLASERLFWVCIGIYLCGVFSNFPSFDLISKLQLESFAQCHI